MEGDAPRFESKPLPGDTNKSASFDANATAPSAVEAPRAKLVEPTISASQSNDANPEFSVARGAVRAIPAATSDATQGLAGSSVVQPVHLEATEADVSIPTTARDAGDDLPQALGGYQILKLLGRGGMGAVYLARQVSLDRPVALKVMNSEWAKNPNFLVRFTREAYAAAQLVHHNVVQVYDIDEDRGVHYFSMEYVEGRSLGDLLRTEGRLPADVAAGYILQAARGLQFAHDRGMIHRDIKPDNLLLNAQGIVKVADLGLVRTPGMAEEPIVAEVPPGSRLRGSLSNVTAAGQAMGTPAYMSPEQARDATNIDHRADIYSLGCTLYVLITGRPVFQGTTAMEVMTKHAYDPVTPPEVIVSEVPRALSDVILKMIAKKPEDRYVSMNEAIQALEDFMGLHGKDQQAQTEQHLRKLENGVKGFLTAPAAQLRSWVLLGFFGGAGAIFLLLLLFGAWRLAGAVLGLGALTSLAYFLVHGLTHRTPLFLRCRDLAFSLSWLDLGKIALGGLLFVGILWLFGLFGGWFLAGILAVGLAVGMHFALDRKIALQRASAVESVETLLRTLRSHGLSEEALHEFVCKNAGEHWEEFFEALFGYEAKLAARLRYGVGPKGSRPRFAGWRDPIIRWLERYQRQRHEARERKHLQAIEQKNLEAQGVAAGEAKQKAEAVANAMVLKAAEIKKEAALMDEIQTMPDVRNAATARRTGPVPRRVNVQDLFLVADAPPSRPARTGQFLGDLLGAIFGGSTRFILGAVLLLGCLAWLYKNDLLPSTTNFDESATYTSIWEKMQEAKPLSLPLPSVLLQIFNSMNPGVAGIILLLTSIWRSWKIGLLTIVGAAIMVIGPVTGLVPTLGMPAWVVCLAAGAVVALVGFVIGRDT
jgi:hypothetical protein